MDVNKQNIEDKVLLEDLEEAYTLAYRRNYCIDQMDKCLNMHDNKGVRHWGLDHQRAVDDFKNLQVKKNEHERKMRNE